MLTILIALLVNPISANILVGTRFTTLAWSSKITGNGEMPRCPSAWPTAAGPLKEVVVLIRKVLVHWELTMGHSTE